jgi:hypothetical protein
MDILLWLSAQIVWTAWAIVSWLLLQLFWLLLWSLVPIGVAALLCVLAAERLFGKRLVRPWLAQLWLRVRDAVWRRTPRMFFALWAVPARVLTWFVLFTLWHAVVNLCCTPSWRPWPRAWRRRWGYA